jgi:prepilin-type N-terminal cleavage/methylation domain-containing protein
MKKAFTLIELSVVIAIIVLLMAVEVDNISTGFRQVETVNKTDTIG